MVPSSCLIREKFNNQLVYSIVANLVDYRSICNIYLLLFLTTPIWQLWELVSLWKNIYLLLFLTTPIWQLWELVSLWKNFVHSYEIPFVRAYRKHLFVFCLTSPISFLKFLHTIEHTYIFIGYSDLTFWRRTVYTQII